MAAKYTNSTIITVAGKSRRLDEWAKCLGCPVQTIIGRIDRGWDESRAVTGKVTAAPSNRGAKVAPEVLMGDEIGRLLDAARKSKTAVRDRAMIATSYRAGLRCCEVLALRPKDIDEAARTITVLHGKGDKRRVVGIDAAAWAIVQEWIEDRKTINPPADAPLFCTRTGGPISSRQVRAMMARRGNRAGLEKHVHFHGLRHTTASEMAREGVELLDIAGALGHSNASTTDRYLKQLSPTSVLDAMRGRSWGPPAASSPATVKACNIAAPGWIDRLRADIGDRLEVFHDGRKDENSFRAVVLLF